MRNAAACVALPAPSRLGMSVIRVFMPAGLLVLLALLLLLAVLLALLLGMVSGTTGALITVADSAGDGEVLVGVGGVLGAWLEGLTGKEVCCESNSDLDSGFWFETLVCGGSGCLVVAWGLLSTGFLALYALAAARRARIRSLLLGGEGGAP